MTYRIRRDKPLQSELLRILGQQSAKARRSLDQHRDDPERAVHRARQCFKRVRALLDLAARNIDGVDAKRLFGDLGRRLSVIRDLDAAIGAIQRIAARPDVSAPEHQALLELERTMRERREERFESRASQTEDLLSDIGSTLSRFEKTLRTTSLKGVDRRHVARRARRRLRKARNAFGRAVESGEFEDFHRCRKHTQRALNQTRLLRKLDHDRIPEPSERDLMSLAKALGQLQDLSLVEKTLAELKLRGESSARSLALCRLTEACRRDALEQIVPAGAALAVFSQRPPRPPIQAARQTGKYEEKPALGRTSGV